MQWMNDRMEKRTFSTLDSNLFLDMHFIYYAIPDYHIEKRKRKDQNGLVKMCLVVIWNRIQTM